MAEENETDRRQRARTGILESLGDITYSILRQYGVARSASVASPVTPSPVAKG
ncbi:MAG TPA: hypothetical protein VKW78_09425 [Terriglobales bacterium]|nr:hypothetical protein [Terriglobales bacterium]